MKKLPTKKLKDTRLFVRMNSDLSRKLVVVAGVLDVTASQITREAIDEKLSKIIAERADVRSAVSRAA